MFFSELLNLTVNYSCCCSLYIVIIKREILFINKRRRRNTPTNKAYLQLLVSMFDGILEKTEREKSAKSC